MYKAPHRIYLNRAGQVCTEDDPDAASLLVAEGGTLPDAVARRYGLIPDEAAPEPEPAEPEPPTEGKALAAPPATKALPGPKARK